MLTAILLPILTAAAAGAPPQEVAAAAATPQVQVRLSGDEFVRGDRARVYVTAGADGYMLVLHAEPDGRIHVLFPVDPGDDNYVRGGKTYEVRGRGDRDAFTVYGPRGTGTVYVAFSQDPFEFGGFTLNGHWDYRAQAFAAGDDPEADLTALAQQMAGTEQFTYDLVRYDVVQRVARGSSYDDYGTYYPYSGYYGGWYRPWRSGIYFGVSFGSPWYACWACNGYYDPWFYSSWYDWDDFYYPFYRPYYYAYYGSYWHRPYYVNRYAYYGYGWGYGRDWRSGYWRSPTHGGQHYGFYYVQPGRRTLTLYGSGPSLLASSRRPVAGGAMGGRAGASATAVSGRRMVMPPATDGGRVVTGPRRAGSQVGTQPRVTQPRPLDAGPRATPRRDAAPAGNGVVRRVPAPAVDGRGARSPRGLVPLRQNDARPTPSRDVSGPRALRGLSPVESRGVERQPYGRPQLERRQVERPDSRGYYAPSRPQRSASPDYAPRGPVRSEPREMSRPSAPRVSAPARSSGPSRPSAPSRGSVRAPSGGRRRGG